MSASSAHTTSDPARDAGLRVREPALFFSAYVHKHLPGFLPHDPRLLILEQVDAFAAQYGLAPAGEPWRYARARDVDLVALDRSPPSYQPLVNLSGGDASELHQCLVYAHSDALIVQVVIGRFDPWTGSLAEGWQQLRSGLRGGLDLHFLEKAKHETFGASAVYWAMADECEPAAYAAEMCCIMEGRSARCTQTDIGALWAADAPTFPEAPSVFQDRWVLVTAGSEEAEAEANRRYNQPHRTGPPSFAIAALARHKVAFEREQYRQALRTLDRMRRTLERRTDWIIDTQRYHGMRLGRLRSDESTEFQEKVTRATNTLADYRQTASLIQDLRRTLAINRANFLIHCSALISAEGVKRVESAERQEEAASEFLRGWQQEQRDEVFSTELGQMQGLCDQVDADIAYSEQLIERHEAALRSGRQQLQIAADRQTAEINGSGAINTGLVVASLAAVVAVELLKVRDFLQREPSVAVNVLLLAVTGAFSVVLWLAGGDVRPALRRGSFAVATGFLVSALVALAWGDMALWITTGLFILGALAGGFGHGLLELQSLHRHRRRRERRAVVMASLDKLIYADEELPELLEDLPPTRMYRRKHQASLLAKIARKNAAEAARQGITVEQLKASGEDYKITDVGDAIGIRYVVAPWRVAEVVHRVRAVTHPVRVEYKDMTTTLGRRVRTVTGPIDVELYRATSTVPIHWRSCRPVPPAQARTPIEEDDPHYRGRYRGFRLNYKAVHVDVDLWGVGARKDVNLLAEVQVRTPLQNLLADWFHDILYKEKPRRTRSKLATWRRARKLRRLLSHARRGTAPSIIEALDYWCPWLNRPIVRTFIWLTNLELRLFRSLMEWRETDRS
jgi:ppGpp synthetase/RelA/SpoT-type nucleotidyltranferase